MSVNVNLNINISEQNMVQLMWTNGMGEGRGSWLNKVNVRMSEVSSRVEGQICV